MAGDEAGVNTEEYGCSARFGGREGGGTGPVVIRSVAAEKHPDGSGKMTPAAVVATADSTTLGQRIFLSHRPTCLDTTLTECPKTSCDP
jgi:hypothetical protein